MFFCLFSESAFKQMKKALRNLWKKFLDSISSSVSDYLSIDHLGLILKRLAEKGNTTQNIGEKIQCEIYLIMLIAPEIIVYMFI